MTDPSPFPMRKELDNPPPPAVGTRCWRNVPATVTVPVITLDESRKWTGAEFIENMAGALDEGAVDRWLAERAAEDAECMKQEALDDLRQQLAEAREERDRYIARCLDYEKRMEAIRREAR